MGMMEKKNGNYYLGFRDMLGLYRDDGEENGNYYVVCWDYKPSYTTLFWVSPLLKFIQG